MRHYGFMELGRYCHTQWHQRTVKPSLKNTYEYVPAGTDVLLINSLKYIKLTLMNNSIC